MIGGQQVSFTQNHIAEIAPSWREIEYWIVVNQVVVLSLKWHRYSKQSVISCIQQFYVYTTMSKFHLPTEGHERSYLIGELESLGLSSIKINQIMKDGDDNNELRSLVQTTKDCLLWKFNEAHQQRIIIIGTKPIAKCASLRYKKPLHENMLNCHSKETICKQHQD